LTSACANRATSAAGISADSGVSNTASSGNPDQWTIVIEQKAMAEPAPAARSSRRSHVYANASAKPLQTKNACGEGRALSIVPTT